MDFGLNVIDVSADPILIRRNRDAYGFLGNMSPMDIQWDGQIYPSSEALFQCLRVKDGDLQVRIREATNAFLAKKIASAHSEKRKVIPLSEEDLDNMRLCLQVKTKQYPNLRRALVQTGARTIIEDCTFRQEGSGLFWGAALRGDSWHGLNWLGVLWMEIRSELQGRELAFEEFLQSL